MLKDVCGPYGARKRRSGGYRAGSTELEYIFPILLPRSPYSLLPAPSCHAIVPGLVDDRVGTVEL